MTVVYTFEDDLFCRHDNPKIYVYICLGYVMGAAEEWFSPVNLASSRKFINKRVNPNRDCATRDAHVPAIWRRPPAEGSNSAPNVHIDVPVGRPGSRTLVPIHDEMLYIIELVTHLLRWCKYFWVIEEAIN